MSADQPEPKPARRGLWLVVVIVAGLLVLTTCDVLRNFDRSSPAALRRAAFDGDEATVRRLVKAHPEWIDSVGSTNGQTRMLGDLYERAMKSLGKSPSSSPNDDPEKKFQNWEAFGPTALFHAVAQKRVSMALILLEAGAHTRTKLSTGQSIVPLAIFAGDTNLMAALERRGANLNELDPGTSMTALHEATFAQRPEMLLYLIGRKNQSVNAMDHRGFTALHYTAGRAQLDLVQILVTNGADLSLTNRQGLTALDAARLRAAQRTDSNAVAVVEWLEAFAATNQPSAKPSP